MSISQLAFLGGPPQFQPAVPLYGPVALPAGPLTNELAEILHSGRLTKGPAVARFESALAEVMGVPHVVLVSSGLAALGLLVEALRLEGEAVVPAYCFAPVIQALVAAGLTPRPVDVDPVSWNLDPVAAESAIGTRTSLILAVHTSGFPAPASALEAVAARRRLALVFDGAHATGASLEDRRVGGFGIAEFFSFTPSKLVTAGEGGAVATKDARLAQEVRALRDYGKSDGGTWTGRGTSARMPDLSAAVGRASLARLGEEIDRRAALAQIYRDGLGGISGLRFQAHLPGTAPVYRDVSLRVASGDFGVTRDALRSVLQLDGVGTGAYFSPAVPELPIARRFLPAATAANRAFLPTARAVASEVLNLPAGPTISSQTAHAIVDLIRTVHAESARISARFQTVSAPRPPRDPAD